MYFLDYSGGKISGATIRADGYEGVIRYIDSPDRLGTKHTNLAEYQDHLAHGVIVRLVFEISVDDDAGGWSAGVANAKRAKAGSDYLRYPGVIYFAHDETVLPSASLWQQYLDGAASILGRARVGAYGFANAIDAAQGHASAFWQSGSRSLIRPVTNIWQDNNWSGSVAGIPVDRSLVINDYNYNPIPFSGEDDDMAERLEPKFGADGVTPVQTHDTIPVNGKGSLFLATSYGESVDITGLTAVFDTNSTPQTASLPNSTFTLLADRPGPIHLPANTRHVVVQYVSAHPFKGWSA